MRSFGEQRFAGRGTHVTTSLNFHRFSTLRPIASLR